jgi:hypothetical protein
MRMVVMDPLIPMRMIQTERRIHHVSLLSELSAFNDWNACCTLLPFQLYTSIAVAGHQLECIHESCCVLGFMTTNDAPHQEL